MWRQAGRGMCRAGSGVQGQTAVRAQQSPERAPWEQCGEGRQQGEPAISQLVADGPSEGTGRGKRDRSERSCLTGVRHLDEGRRVFSLCSYVWSHSDSAGKTGLHVCRRQQEGCQQ